MYGSGVTATARTTMTSMERSASVQPASHVGDGGAGGGGGAAFSATREEPEQDARTTNATTLVEHPIMPATYHAIPVITGAVSHADLRWGLPSGKDHGITSVALGCLDDHSGLALTKEWFIDNKPEVYDFAGERSTVAEAQALAMLEDAGE
jgi:hypothetical protein